MSEENEVSVVAGDEGDEGPVPLKAEKPKKNVLAKFNSMPAGRKFLVATVVVGAVAIPAIAFYHHEQLVKEEQTLEALKLKNQEFLKTHPPHAPVHQVVNGFAQEGAGGPLAGNPNSGGGGFPGSPLQGQGGPPPPPGGNDGGLTASEAASMQIMGNINRIKKMSEVATVNEALIQKNLGALTGKLNDMETRIAQMNQSQKKMFSSFSGMCSASRHDEDRSQPMQRYSTEPQNVPVFQGWRVLGASGNGAVVIDPQGATHYVAVGMALSGIRVVSIDPDTGYVKFANSEVLKPS